MVQELTLSIVKPDAVRRNIIGKIVERLETTGLKIVAQRMLHMTKEQAAAFYVVHKDRPFYSSLIETMSSGPIVVQVLSGENAVQRNREIMGATNPKDAAMGTIRKDFAEDIEANSVHGSDSVENAEQEITFFFKEDEIILR